MYKHYLIGDYFLGETNHKIKFQPFHKYYIDKDGKKVINTKYDEGQSKQALLNFIRLKRNEMLRNTDIYMISDYPLTTTEKTNIKNYRQDLRNMPQNINNNNFTDFSFPQKSETIK